MIYPADVHIKLYNHACYGDICIASKKVREHNLLVVEWQCVFQYFTIFPCEILGRQLIINFN